MFRFVRYLSLLIAVLALSVTGCNVSATNANLNGLTMFEQGNFQAADSYFRQAIQADPQDADGYYNLAANYHRVAKVYQRPIDLQQAESYYQQAIARNPNHAESYRGLSVLLTETNRGGEAYALLDRWARYNPSQAAPFIELARLSDELGDPVRAEQALIAAIRNAPNNPVALAQLGRLRESAGDTYQALQNYQRALAADPRNTELARHVAWLTQNGTPAYSPQYGPQGGRLAAQPAYQALNEVPGRF